MRAAARHGVRRRGVDVPAGQEDPIDTLATFRRLFEFDDWANAEVEASIAASHDADQASSARALALLGHVIAARELWLVRLRGVRRDVVVWPATTLESARAAREADARAWRGALDGLGPDDLGRAIAYVNSRGERWESRVEDVLTHVPLHGVHHRAQIAGDFAARGIPAPYVDFVHAVRTRRIR